MKKNYLLALLSAFLLWVAWPPVPFAGPVLLVALVPLLLSVENILGSNLPKKGKKVFAASFLAFAVWNTASIYWVYNSLSAVMDTWVAMLISIIPFGLGALLMAIAFWLYYRMRLVSSFTWSYIALTCFWLGYEYLHQSWDLAFPWMNLGNGMAATHQLVQWYEWTGVYGGTLWILLSNILALKLFFAIRANATTRRKRNLAIRFALHLIIPIAVSLFIYAGYREKNNPANVVVVQPNVDPYGKFGSIPSRNQIENLIRLSDSVAQKNTEYFIWPETAMPDYVEESAVRGDPGVHEVALFLQKYKNGNVLSGISSYNVYDSQKTPTTFYHESSGRYIDRYNAAVQLENSPRVQFYHKSKLVPGVEQIPFSALSFLKPLFAGFGGGGTYGRQEAPSVFYSQSGIGAAPVICYESIWGEWVAKSVADGAQFIAIVTNDGWWGNTSGKDQHFQYARLRAIETRRWVARAANTGISGFINQRGDIVTQSKWWVPTALKANINLNSDLTFYVRHEDYIAVAGYWGCLGFMIFLLVALVKKSTSRKAAST